MNLCHRRRTPARGRRGNRRNQRPHVHCSLRVPVIYVTPQPNRVNIVLHHRPIDHVPSARMFGVIPSNANRTFTIYRPPGHLPGNGTLVEGVLENVHDVLMLGTIRTNRHTIRRPLTVRRTRHLRKCLTGRHLTPRRRHRHRHRTRHLTYRCP